MLVAKAPPNQTFLETLCFDLRCRDNYLSLLIPRRVSSDFYSIMPCGKMGKEEEMGMGMGAYVDVDVDVVKFLGEMRGEETKQKRKRKRNGKEIGNLLPLG